MTRIGKCKCGGELTIASYSRMEAGKATAICKKCVKEYPLEMVGKNKYYTLVKGKGKNDKI